MPLTVEPSVPLDACVRDRYYVGVKTSVKRFEEVSRCRCLPQEFVRFARAAVTEENAQWSQSQSDFRGQFA